MWQVRQGILLSDLVNRMLLDNPHGMTYGTACVFAHSAPTAFSAA
jgi:hypothetical protein